MKQEYDRVKLHCTLINSLFRKENEGESEEGGNGERITFDAKPLLENWGQLCLGQVPVNEVHLSIRRAGRKTVKTGYYMPSHIVKLKEESEEGGNGERITFDAKPLLENW